MLTAEKFRETLKEDDFGLVGVTMFGFLMQDAFDDLNNKQALTEGSPDLLMILVEDIASIRAGKLNLTINFFDSPFN